MAFFTWSRAIAAGASDDPLDVAGNSWKYRYLPYDAIVEIIHRATLVSCLVSVTSGSDEIVQESPVSAGGTAGVITGRLNVEPITFKAKAGDLITIRYRNTNAGANTVDGSIELTRSG